jgi:hypothetical protein
MPGAATSVVRAEEKSLMSKIIPAVGFAVLAWLVWRLMDRIFPR